jgi:hypothetical protein
MAKKLVFGIGCAALALGVATMVYDAMFIRHYGVDANDVLTAQGPWLVDWETGTRPAWANCAAWKWGLIFSLIGLILVLPELAWRTHSERRTNKK